MSKIQKVYLFLSIIVNFSNYSYDYSYPNNFKDLFDIHSKEIKRINKFTPNFSKVVQNKEELKQIKSLSDAYLQEYLDHEKALAKIEYRLKKTFSLEERKKLEDQFSNVQENLKEISCSFVIQLCVLNAFYK